MAGGRSAGSVTWDQVLAWRMRRQHVLEPGRDSAVEIARRLAGVQAQVGSAAELAIAVRQERPAAGEVRRALWEDGSLIKTWGMRGTLHLFPAADAGAYLVLSAAARHWERPGWQKNFGPSPTELEALGEAATQALADGGRLTREQLSAELTARTDAPHLAEALGSGWGALLKPLAWWGVLCFGPPEGNRVTFCSPERRVPGWKGLPPENEASRTAIRGYLGAHGPASLDTFNAWLMRKATPKRTVRRWFAELEDEVTTVDVEGTELYVLREHVDELRATAPTREVRLLGSFDHYILGPGTSAEYMIPAEHRTKVSRPAGWISPVVLHGGRVAGTWNATQGSITPTLWTDLPTESLTPQISRLQTLLP